MDADTKKRTEIQKRIQEFLNREIGNEYVCSVSYIEKKPSANDQQMRFSNMIVSNMSPMTTPFSVYHGCMKALETNFKNFLVSLYGPEMRLDRPQEQKTDEHHYG